MMKDIVKHAEKHGEFVTLEDGYIYYWPSMQGALTSDDLRELANEIDERNDAWDKQVKDYFNKIESKDA